MKHDPRRLFDAYDQMWRGLQREGKAYYYTIRQTFNLTGDPCQFFFLLRPAAVVSSVLIVVVSSMSGSAVACTRSSPSELCRSSKIGTGC